MILKIRVLSTNAKNDKNLINSLAICRPKLKITKIWKTVWLRRKNWDHAVELFKMEKIRPKIRTEGEKTEKTVCATPDSGDVLAHLSGDSFTEREVAGDEEVATNPSVGVA